MTLSSFSFHLQAFVYFSSWDACCDFVRDHIKNPVSVGGVELNVHFVLQDMGPGSSEVRKLGESIEVALFAGSNFQNLFS